MLHLPARLGHFGWLFPIRGGLVLHFAAFFLESLVLGTLHVLQSIQQVIHGTEKNHRQGMAIHLGSSF